MRVRREVDSSPLTGSVALIEDEMGDILLQRPSGQECPLTDWLSAPSRRLPTGSLR